MGYYNRGRNTSSQSTVYSSRNHRGPRRTANRKKNNAVYINPSRFIKVASMEVQEAYEPTHSFQDFLIHDQLRKNIVTKGFATPTPVQDQTIPAGLEGKDIIGIAGTGTGKTTAFALPLLNKLLHSPSSRALVIAPTRELAQQIEKEIQSLVVGTQIFSILIIGGANMGAQIRNLKRHPQIIIGTPGRIKNHLQERTLRLDQTDIVVLDEVDRMLDMGFLPDVTMILSSVSDQRQSFFFSATMDAKIMTLVNGFTKDPHTVQLQPESTGDNIHQNVVDFRGKEEKISKLHDALIDEEVKKVIVFDETKHGVDKLYKELKARGFNVDAIHGGKKAKDSANEH